MQIARNRIGIVSVIDGMKNSCFVANMNFCQIAYIEIGKRVPKTRFDSGKCLSNNSYLLQLTHFI